jgi:hypothetical protein
VRESMNTFVKKRSLIRNDFLLYYLRLNLAAVEETDVLLNTPSCQRNSIVLMFHTAVFRCNPFPTGTLHLHYAQQITA